MTEAAKPLPGQEPATVLEYVAPMALFIIFTYVEGLAPHLYVPLYTAKIAAVTAALAIWRRPLRTIHFDVRTLPLALIVGAAVFVEWIVLDRWIPYPHLGTRSAFNPFAGIAQPTGRVLFIGLTLYAMAVMVPVMEELFWRSWLIRYLTTPGWQAIAPWQYSRNGYLGVAILFGLAHTEWLVAVVCALAYGWLLQHTKSLFACVAAHGCTNLLLALYILHTGAWKYW
ncbi:MAG: CAAX prenyl protease-related protein [Chthonomonadales bacterium]